MRLDQNVRGIRYRDPEDGAEKLLVADDAGPPYAGWLCYRNVDAWEPLRPATSDEKRAVALAREICSRFGEVRRTLTECRGLLDQAELRIGRGNGEALEAVVATRRNVDRLLGALPSGSIDRVTTNGAA
jgi:hypothetical protein